MKKNLSFYTIIFIASMVVTKLSGLLAKIILARVITPYEYGIITLLVLSLPGLLQIFTNSFLFELISHSREGRKYFGFSMIYSVFSIALIVSFFYLFQTQIFSFLKLPDTSHVLYLLGLFLTIISVTFLGNFTGLFRGLRDYSMASFITTAPSVLRLIILIFAVYAASISGFGALFLIFALPPVIVLLAILAYKAGPIANLLKKSSAVPPKSMLQFGFYVYTVGIFCGFVEQLTKIIVSHDLGIVYQGYYDVSLSVIAILAFSFTAMQFISVPEATNNKDKRDILFKKGELGEITRALFAFMIFCVGILIIYPVQLVALLFSSSYAPAADYIYILAIGYVFLFVQQFMAYLNISTSKNMAENRILFYITLSMSLVYPFFTHFMISFYGFMGAYLSATIALIVYSLLTIYYSKDKTPIHALTYRIERLIVAAGLALVPIYCFNMSFLAGLVYSACVYLLLIFALGYLHKDMLLRVIRKETKQDAPSN